MRDRLLAEFRAAYQLAYHQRYGELRAGRRTKTFDDRGLHPYSEIWGRISVLISEEDSRETTQMVPALLEVTPNQLQRMAEQDAHAQLLNEIRKEQ